MANRRDFLKISTLAGAALLIRPNLNSLFAVTIPGQSVRKFVVPLPGLGPTGLPVASPDTATYPGVDYYRIKMGQFTQQVHPDLPPTTFWGYADVTNGQFPNYRYLGGAIVAQNRRPVRVKFINDLPPDHILPVDTSIMGADGPQNRAVAHLHGGFTPWPSDGGPFAWSTPGGLTGESYIKWLPDKNGSLTADNWYPNQQSARLMWYHDHAIGTTRLNAYAGLATAYVLRDPYENILIKSGVLPSNEIPLIIQDKAFYGDGSLAYPTAQDPADLQDSSFVASQPIPSCVPEFFAETMLVNGAPYPFVEVEQRRYRLRILNASQARFLNLQLYYADPASRMTANFKKPGPPMLQIGTEGGFLPAPVVLNAPPARLTFDANGNPKTYTLLLAPAERAEIIVDFSWVPPNSTLILFNDAPTPFPSGDLTVAGGNLSPDTQNIMQFRVVKAKGRPDLPIPFLPPPVETLNPKRAVTVRKLTLNEGFDVYGRLLQQLGTTDPSGGLDSNGNIYYGLSYDSTPTETPTAGTTEIWQIYNTTGDTHPMHFHLANVQVMGRAPFDPNGFIPGPLRPPDPNERGWKETVRMNPGEMTQIIMRFDLPPAPVAVPESPRTGGHEYVWHCHILEHEEHDMMRPLVVKP